jgi:cysteinyl-tRNA synthetase
LSDDDKIAIKAFLDDAAHIFGVSFETEEVNARSDDLLELISEVRSELRANKQYDLSDKIRDNLQALGYEIND